MMRSLIVIAALTACSGAWAANCSQLDYYLQTQADVDALGAENCDTITYNLYIYNSQDITDLSSLSNLTNVGNWLQISNNDALTSLAGLDNLVDVDAVVLIQDNAVLADLDGLSALTSIGASNRYSGTHLKIKNNDALTNIDGLANVSTLSEKGLEIAYNDSLTNLDGLSGLTSTDSIYIYNNKTLTNLDGLSGMSGDLSTLAIYRNDILANCQGVAQFLDGDSVIGNTELYLNAEGCNSVEEILASVPEPPPEPEPPTELSDGVLWWIISNGQAWADEEE